MRQLTGILQRLLLIYFLLMTTYAFAFTMTKVEWFPFIPWKVLRYHYGMMAPYQGYSTTNADLLAEGKKSDDTWEEIDLAPYYPMHRGSAIMYRRLRSFYPESKELHQKKYEELAALLKKHEGGRGRAYEAVRLTWIEWPTSIEGFTAMKKESEMKKYFITEVTK